MKETKNRKDSPLRKRLNRELTRLLFVVGTGGILSGFMLGFYFYIKISRSLSLVFAVLVLIGLLLLVKAKRRVESDVENFPRSLSSI